MRTIDISGRQVGPEQPCFIIAEAGVNHNGDIGLALKLVEAACSTGVDAIKFQTFKAERLASRDAPKARYQQESTNRGESQAAMLSRLELSEEDHRRLIQHCRHQGLIFLSSPFDERAVDFLVGSGLPALKIPSGEINNIPLLSHAAKAGPPLIVSTGMATLSEVEVAVKTIRGCSREEVVLLHCVSNYPADPAVINLRVMKTLRLAFGLPVGYSDHTLGLEVALAAVALGACVIEKHFTLDRHLPGPDHQMSIEPGELTDLVKGIRKIEAALGHGRKEPAAGELDTAVAVRKSLFAAKDIPAGTLISREAIAFQRPGDGLPPTLFDVVLGRLARIDIPAGAKLEWSMLA